MSASACKHGRIGSCAYCLCRIQAHHYWEMVRWRNELRRAQRRTRKATR